MRGQSAYVPERGDIVSEAPKGFFIYTSMNTPGERFNQSVRLDDGRVVEFALDKEGYLYIEVFAEDSEGCDEGKTVFEKQL